MSGRFEQSFDYYSRGNALKRAASGYRPETTAAGARQQREVCTAALFARHAGSGSPAPDPIFIVRFAAVRLHAHRANPGVALRHRGNAGAR